MKKKNDEINYRLKRILIISIIGIIFSFYLVIDNLISDIKIDEIIIALILFISSIYFLIQRTKIKNRQIKK